MLAWQSAVYILRTGQRKKSKQRDGEEIRNKLPTYPCGAMIQSPCSLSWHFGKVEPESASIF